VLDCVEKSAEWLGKSRRDSVGGHVDAIRNDPFDEEKLKNWTRHPLARLEAIFPGFRDLIETYELDITAKPMVHRSSANPLAAKIGYRPSRHFGTFLAELRRLDKKIGREGVLAMKCPFGTRNW
jgi:hypothetical protein